MLNTVLSKGKFILRSMIRKEYKNDRGHFSPIHFRQFHCFYGK